MKAVISRLSLLLFLLLSSITVVAQKMTVESFELLSGDITARAKPKKDINGNNCAVVKVSLPLQGVKFDDGVIDVVYKTGEYWVYMGERSPRLQIKHDNYHPLYITFADFGIKRVESNATYRLVVQLPTTASTANSSTNSSRPSGSYGTHRGHKWIDLGLPSGTKWAETNLGASSPTDFGQYFAWGEISQKNSYTFGNLKYCTDGEGMEYGKYVVNGDGGKIDGMKGLALNDDAAYTNWGKGWRMPTSEQMKELKEKCKWSWTSMGDHTGYEVVGPNGNTLFLPAAGFRDGSELLAEDVRGLYWSRSLSTQDCNAVVLLLGDGVFVDGAIRCYGCCIRPVLGG